MHPERQHGAPLNGSTLIEVMIGAVVLAMLAIGAAMYVYRSQATILFERNRMAALAAATSRLEALRASAYADIAPPAPNYQWHYLTGNIGAWTHAPSDPDDTIAINGQTVPRITRVRYLDLDGGSPSYDYLQANVRIGYRADAPGDGVTLETYIAP